MCIKSTIFSWTVLETGYNLRVTLIGSFTLVVYRQKTTGPNSSTPVKL